MLGCDKPSIYGIYAHDVYSYIGILVSGFISLTVSRHLWLLGGLYAVVLFVFRRLSAM